MCVHKLISIGLLTTKEVADTIKMVENKEITREGAKIVLTKLAECPRYPRACYGITRIEWRGF